MHPESVSGTVERAQHISLRDWLMLRRPPRPEFFETLDALPPVLVSCARSALPAAEQVQGVLALPGEYCPRNKVHWEWAPERALIFLERAVLYVAGATENAAPQAILLDAGGLLYLRSSLILLYGQLEFKADCGSQTGGVRLEYNSIIWEALSKPLMRFVSAAGEHSPVADAATANTAIFKSVPFKFASGLRFYTLEPGERLHVALFQPELWRRGIFPQQVTPNTLLALTDRKLIVIEESRVSRWQRQPSEAEHGWIFTYIPRDRVAAMSVALGPRWAELRVDLERGAAKDSLAFLIEPAIAEKVRGAWLELEGRVGR